MPEPLLRAQGLTKAYAASGGGARRAVDGVSLTILPGQAVGVAGPSGSGKSTLGRLILGLEPLDVGQLRLAGVDYGRGKGDRPRLARLVQMIWQDPQVHLNPRMSASQAVAEPLWAIAGRTKPRAQAQARDLLARVGLEPGLAERRPHQLSGGQCQRVAIARALALGPRLLICDEAVASLDLPGQLQIVDLLDELVVGGLSVLFISHDLGILARLCAEVHVMDRGAVIESGPVARVLDTPRRELTKRLLAGEPMPRR